MLISVIIPCYNAAGHIEGCLESVKAQRFTNLEVICVDDGSTDDTCLIVERTAERLSLPVRSIQQPNAGAAAARNKGLAAASGAYIQFLDADDRLAPQKLEHQSELVQRTRPTVLVGSFRTISFDGSPVREVVQRPGERDIWMDLMCQRLSITSPNLWEKSAVLAVNGWDEELGSSQEYDLLFRLLRNGATIAFDDAVNTEIHQRRESISHTNLASNWKRFIDLRVRIRDHVRQVHRERDMRPFDQVIFDSIRVLHGHDPEAALAMLHRTIPKDFSPGRSQTSGSGYILAHRLLGFKGAERLRRMLGK